MTAKVSDFTIVVDSREQRPYCFKGAVRAALVAGDYSIVGLEKSITIERKTKSDAFSSLGTGRKRLKCEIERLSHYNYAAIVIESNLAEFLQPAVHSKLHPHAAINMLISWSVKYGIHIYFADSRKLARGLTYRILEKFWKYWNSPQHTERPNGEQGKLGKIQA